MNDITTPIVTVPVDPNVYVFPIAGAEPATSISIELGTIPVEARMDLLKQKIREYVTNSVNQASVRHKRAMEPSDAYAKACEVDPLQTAVPKPTAEAPTVDLIAVAAAARDRLYKNEIRKQGDGSKVKVTRDPLVKMVTDAVVRELFDKRKAADASYKWTDAVKAVGSSGIDYLNSMIEERVAAGAERATLEKYRDERYIKPIMLALGLSDNKATKDQSLL